MEFIHVMSEKLCIGILTSENMVTYNDNMVFRDFFRSIKIHICKSIIERNIMETHRV